MGIKVKELPEVDDEFASEVSEFETLDEYKARRKDRRSKSAKIEEAKTKKEDQAVEKAVENAADGYSGADDRSAGKTDGR